MPTIYDLKPRFQALLRPAVRRLHALGVSPNAVTLAALLGSIVVGHLVAGAHHRPGLFLLLPLWLFARMALNAVDGMLAREHGLASPLGAVLNELADVLSDLALYLPLALALPGARWAAVAFAVAAVLTEFAGVLSQALGHGRRYDGPVGKSDRAFVVGALGLATALLPSAARLWSPVLWVCAALMLLTVRNRVRHAAGGA